MGKLTAGLVVFSILAALVIGAGAVFVRGYSAPEVTAGLAAQEQAKADELRAQAAAAWARAERERLDAQATAKALAEITAGKQTFAILAGYGAGFAVLVLLVGLALAVVTFATTRARLVYPNGQGFAPILVERQLGGGLRVVDLGPRGLWSVAQIDGAGVVSLTHAGREESAVALAGAEIQRAAVVGAVASAAGRQAPADVRPMIEQARQVAPVFANTTGAPAAPRFVYVKAPGAQYTEENRTLSDVREFVEGAELRGLGRRAWLGYRFRSGHECTRARYDELIDMLKRAGVITPAGQSWRLAVPAAEALGAFGVGRLDEQDAQAGQGADGAGVE